MRQTGYRVLVASRPELAREGRADVWDSRRVASEDPWAAYAGRPLRSRARYYWAVRVWGTADGAGAVASGWSPPASFETALLDTSEWRGRWIAGPERATALTPAEGAADDARIRAAGEFCRPVAWPAVPIIDRVPNNQGECREVGSGAALAAERAPSVRLVGREGDRVVYDVGSGRYRFRIANAP